MLIPYCILANNFYPVADTGGLQWFQLKPALKIAHAPNLLMSRHVSDKIATCVIEGLCTGKKLHTLAFEITITVWNLKPPLKISRSATIIC